MRRWVGMTLLAMACGSTSSTDADTGDGTTGSGSTSGLPTSASGTTSTTAQTTASTSTEGTSTSVGETDSPGETTGGSSETPCDDFETFLESLDGVDPATAASMAQAELEALVYSESGLPLLCADGRIGFVTYRDNANPPNVAGEFNDWDETALATTAPVDGIALFVVFAEVDVPSGGSAYKFVFDATEFVADPYARRFDWDEFGEYSLTGPRTGRGHHERWPGFDQGVGVLAPRDITVWAPPDLDQAGPVGVLYMHDGQNLFDPDATFGHWEASTTAEAGVLAGELPPFLIVGIDNTPARFDEYSHAAEDLGNGPVGGQGDEYAGFIVDGLKPFIDDRYPTDPGRDATGIMGSSMGGLISLYTAWLHPQVFGYAGSMSGTLWWGEGGPSAQTVIDLYEDQPPTDLTIYLDSGGNPPCPGSLDNYCETVQMRDVLLGEGWVEGDDLHYVWSAGAGHNEAAWAARLGAALQSWFPGSSR